jgi:uncharacterized membrane protein SpoIIM required for sporulation
VIVDLQRFIARERPYWNELDGILDRLQRDPYQSLGLEPAKRLHYLYERASADLARLADFSSETEIRIYLESLVARAYGEIYETRKKRARFTPWKWLARDFPRTFRRHIRAFLLVVAICIAGSMFGGLAIAVDPAAKSALMPFPHLQGDPSDRVAQEESVGDDDRLAGAKGQFSAMLMTHNTRVSILTLALGMTYGVGTVIIIFYNGVIIGAVAADYVLAGEGTFLVGWLLPHGSVEIPAILIAGQASLVLAGALIGWGQRLSLRARLRAVTNDLMMLIVGVAGLLIWAGIIEAFFSQYHAPILPYSIKITFGALQLAGLAIFLARAGSGEKKETNQPAGRF